MIRLFVIVSILFMGAAFRDQSIAVKGRLICGAKPATDVLLKLWDEDIAWPDPHDLLDQSYSNSSGEFHLTGATREFTAMEPVLSIYHDCNDGIKSGMRKLSFGLPDQYITAGLTPAKVADIGVINLELSYKEEERVDVYEEIAIEKEFILFSDRLK
ncbi:Transthyretin-like [Parelaphostrongylus tenuis]|uniref:Transthyretin-like n=1 Tax=Parelaphostrongylus tenuis TaxID=148309 RepID=A0AAD5QJ89_PARTN|nr:Transthyretin-like [Parelaphostrongylus tenuis]